jgi:hypothetical protein
VEETSSKGMITASVASHGPTVGLVRLVDSRWRECGGERDNTATYGAVEAGSFFRRICENCWKMIQCSSLPFS